MEKGAELDDLITALAHFLPAREHQLTSYAPVEGYPSPSLRNDLHKRLNYALDALVSVCVLSEGCEHMAAAFEIAPGDDGITLFFSASPSISLELKENVKRWTSAFRLICADAGVDHPESPANSPSPSSSPEPTNDAQQDLILSMYRASLHKLRQRVQDVKVCLQTVDDLLARLLQTEELPPIRVALETFHQDLQHFTSIMGLSHEHTAWKEESVSDDDILSLNECCESLTFSLMDENFTAEILRPILPNVEEMVLACTLVSSAISTIISVAHLKPMNTVAVLPWHNAWVPTPAPRVFRSKDARDSYEDSAVPHTAATLIQYLVDNKIVVANTTLICSADPCYACVNFASAVNIVHGHKFRLSRECHGLQNLPWVIPSTSGTTVARILRERIKSDLSAYTSS